MIGLFFELIELMVKVTVELIKLTINLTAALCRAIAQSSASSSRPARQRRPARPNASSPRPTSSTPRRMSAPARRTSGAGAHTTPESVSAEAYFLLGLVVLGLAADVLAIATGEVGAGFAIATCLHLSMVVLTFKFGKRLGLSAGKTWLWAALSFLQIVWLVPAFLLAREIPPKTAPARAPASSGVASDWWPGPGPGIATPASLAPAVGGGADAAVAGMAMTHSGTTPAAPHPPVTISASESRGADVAAGAAAKETGTDGPVAECVAYLANRPDVAEHYARLASATESYAQEYDEVAKRLRAGGSATAAEIIGLETAVNRRNEQLVVAAHAMPDAALHMEAASLVLQAEHRGELDHNQVLMLTDQLEIALNELTTRRNQEPSVSGDGRASAVVRAL
jgi:hypothetical protein